MRINEKTDTKTDLNLANAFIKYKYKSWQKLAPIKFKNTDLPRKNPRIAALKSQTGQSLMYKCKSQCEPGWVSPAWETPASPHRAAAPDAPPPYKP